MPEETFIVTELEEVVWNCSTFPVVAAYLVLQQFFLNHAIILARMTIQ